MDQTTISRIKAEWDRELTRFESRAHPDNFPTLPPISPKRYFNNAFHEAEQQHFWPKTWLFAGHVNDLPQAGSYKLWRDSGAPIIIIRGEDQKIRAFYNTCQHRGGPLVKEDSGTVRALACKYHCWRYDLEGKLKAVPDEHEFPGLVKEDKSLVEVPCQLWGNFIFVNRDPEAESLIEFLGDMNREFSDFGFGSRNIFAKQSYEIDCNWKAAIDTFQEVYHTRQVHPHTIAAYLDYRSAIFTLYKNGHSRLVLPIKQTEEAKSAQVLDAGGRSNLTPEHEITRTGNRSYTVFPNIVTPTAEFQFPFLVFWPLSINKCRMDVVFTAPEGHDDPSSEECAMTVAAFTAVMEEDLGIMNHIQESLQTGGITDIQLSYAERRIYQHHEAVDKIIGNKNIPDGLAVPPLMEQFAENW